MPIVDVTHQHISEETYVNEEAIIEADSTTDMDVFLDTICASADCYDESAIQDIKQTVLNVSDLWKQWRKYTNSFVKHREYRNASGDWLSASHLHSDTATYALQRNWYTSSTASTDH